MGCATSNQVNPMALARECHIDAEADSRLERPGGKEDGCRHGIRLPLTEQEVLVVMDSWKAISVHTGCIGMATFIRVVETHGEVKLMFQQFRGVDKPEMERRKSLESHVNMVMNVLHEAISNLDETGYVIELLLAIGKSHRRFDCCRADVFWAIEEPFVSSVKNVLGNRLTTQLERSYSRTIHFLLTTLVTGFTSDIK